MTRGRVIALTAALICLGLAFTLISVYRSGGTSVLQDSLRHPSEVADDSVLQYVLNDNVLVGKRVEAVNAVMEDQELTPGLSLKLSSNLESMSEHVQRAVLRNFSLMPKVRNDVAEEISEYLTRHASENDDRSWFAAKALGNVRTENVSGKVISALLQALDIKGNIAGINDGPQLRNYAADSLGYIGRQAPEAVDRLTREATTVEAVEDSVFRIKCARALVRIGVMDRQVVEYLKNVSTSGRSEYVRSMARGVLDDAANLRPKN